MKERRKHPRISMNGWVDVWGEHSDEPLRGYVDNISLNGISFFLKENFSVGAKVVFSLHFFSDDQLEFIRALGAQVISSVGSGVSFQIRAQFLESITPEDEPVLFDFLTSKKKPIDFGYTYRSPMTKGRSYYIRGASNALR